MKILILANSDSGLYQFRKELIERLSENNEILCGVPNSDGFIGKIERLGCRCKVTDLNRRGMNQLEDLRLLQFYIKLVKRFRPDVVFTYTIKPNVYGGIACQLFNIPYLSNVTGMGTTIENGGLLSVLTTTMYKIGLKKASCVFFQNKDNYRFFVEKKIVYGKSRIIPGSGVNCTTHNIEPYPKTNDVFNFLFVGRVMKDKGIEELLLAIEELHNEGKRVFLDVVGGCDEDYTEMLLKYEEQGIVKYHGQQINVHDFYARALCVVLPSYHEGMANVMLESASTGRPVITTRIPGCQETFDEGVTGLGCNAKDVASLKSAMTKMYLMTFEQREEMGLAGHKKVKNEFDRNIVVNAYIEEISAIKNTDEGVSQNEESC